MVSNSTGDSLHDERYPRVPEHSFNPRHDPVLSAQMNGFVYPDPTHRYYGPRLVAAVIAGTPFSRIVKI